MELSFPLLSLPAPSFLIPSRTRAHIIPTPYTVPCHPREPEMENEPHYMQIGFNHLEQMTQEVAGKCTFEFPLDVS